MPDTATVNRDRMRFLRAVRLGQIALHGDRPRWTRSTGAKSYCDRFVRNEVAAGTIALDAFGTYYCTEAGDAILDTDGGRAGGANE